MTTSFSRSGSAAVLADLLTILRFPAAVTVFGLGAMGSFDGAALVLCVAWLSDVMDGRLARSTEVPSRFGPLDVYADTGVALGSTGGLVVAGHLPAGPTITVTAGLLFLAIWRHHQMPAMTFMAAAHVAMLTIALRHGSWGGPLMLAVIVSMAVFDRQRLMTVLIPRFLDGFRRSGGSGETGRDHSRSIRSSSQ